MGRMTAVVLGAAAGGGYPQWNCNCPICRLAWAGDGRVKFCTQASVALSADGVHWVLLNASPDLRAQVTATHALHPRDGLRDSPIETVVLTGGEIDQVAGLLDMRERQAFTVCGHDFSRPFQLDDQDGFAIGWIFGMHGGNCGFEGKRIHDLHGSRQEATGNHGSDGITGLLERLITREDRVKTFSLG